MTGVKVKTFRNIFFAVVAAYVALWYFSPVAAADILFPNKENTLIDTGDFMALVVLLLAIPFFVGAIVFFKHNKHLVMTKLGIAYFTLGFLALIILPYAAYPSRTEITAETITKHNLIGQVTKVYEIEDAESVTVGLDAETFYSQHRLPKIYVDFVYSVNFADGYSYDFGDPSDDRLWNIIIDKVDETVKEKGIEKKLIGEYILENGIDPLEISDYYTDIYPYKNKIEALMYGHPISYEPEYEYEEYDEPEGPTYYNFLLGE